MLGWSGFQIWTACWQVAMILTPLVLTAAILWLKSQFVTKTEATGEKNRVDARLDTLQASWSTSIARLDDHRHEQETRLKAVENYVERPAAQHKLAAAVATVQGELNEWRKFVEVLAHQMETRAADQNRQFDTFNTYLHTLVERGLR